VPVDDVYRSLRGALSGDVRADEPMRKHTTFRIGGPAAYFVTCDTLSDLAASTRILCEANVEWTVLGRGSNVLVSDSGWSGAVIVLGRDFRKHTVEDDHLHAGAGAVLAALVQEAYSRGLSGLEFAVGIPGTLGGALAMNAGGRERWIGSVVESVSLFVPAEGLCAVRGPEVVWGYRRSGLSERGIIVEAVLRVQQADSDSIRYAMDGSLRRRKLSQPMGAASAGSVFVNPEGDSAGRLIEAAGLKGARVGGAAVSAMHANFIVNEGGATASDVMALGRRIMRTIEETYGIELKPEIRFLGTFEES
jgi:UDP-N-acetylmuramate dehydrogenase